MLQDGIFYTVRESIEMEKSEYHAIVEELQIVGDDGDNYNILAACPTEFEFEGDRYVSSFRATACENRESFSSCAFAITFSLHLPARDLRELWQSEILPGPWYY